MKLFIITIFVSAISLTVFANTITPYSGQENRDIKSLSQQEVAGYLNGKGLGYAKAAELNQFPGPRHVLDIAKELKLTQEQTRQTRAVFDVMKSQATTVGKQFIEKEHQLDQFFASSAIDAARLKILLSAIGELEAKLRFVHLNAHLEQKALLTGHQIQLYDQLRGYSLSQNKEHHHGH